MLWSTSGSDSSISNKDSIRNLVREGSGSLLEPSSSFSWVSNQRTMKEMLQSTPEPFSLSRSMNARTNHEKDPPWFIQTVALLAPNSYPAYDILLHLRPAGTAPPDPGTPPLSAQLLPDSLRLRNRSWRQSALWAQCYCSPTWGGHAEKIDT